jgi:DNA polymerase III subunit beta
MKFSCTRDNLTKTLATVSHIASKNSHLPILQNVLITATGEGVTLTATNLEIGVTAKLRGKVEEPGTLTVPATLFYNYVNLLTSDRVDIESEETNLIISAESQNTKLKGQLANEFPLIPEVENIAEYELPAHDLRTGLSQVVVATSPDQSRPELTGIQWRWFGKELKLAATDSYRLAEKRIHLEKEAQNTKAVVIPASSVHELLRILPDSEEDRVRCVVSESQMLFEIGDIAFTTRLIEVAFPEYERIIPQQHRTQLSVSRQEFVQAIKAASLFSKTGIHDVNLHADAQEQSLTITSVNSQVGENVSKLTTEIQGETNTIVFNYRYLLDGLQQIGGETVQIFLIDSTTPGVMRTTGPDAENYFYIIMPIKQ